MKGRLQKKDIAKSLTMIEQHQLRKVVAAAKKNEPISREDMRLIERLKAEARRSEPLPKKKRGRGRPKKSLQIAQKIERLMLEKLQERMENDQKLTAADYAFIEKVKQQEREQEPHAQQTAKVALAQRLQNYKETLFDSLCWVVENSKSHQARVVAAGHLRKWADESDYLMEPYEIEDAKPEDQKVPE